MKKVALLISFVFAAGVAMAQDAPKADAAPAKAPAKAEAKATTASKTAKAAVKTHKVEAEVVSTDTTAKTITIKSDTGDKTAPVEGKALTQYKNAKAGEKWTLTCRDNEAGEHQAVVAMVKTPAVKKTAAKKSSK